MYFHFSVMFRLVSISNIEIVQKSFKLLKYEYKFLELNKFSDFRPSKVFCFSCLRFDFHNFVY